MFDAGTVLLVAAISFLLGWLLGRAALAGGAGNAAPRPAPRPISESELDSLIVPLLDAGRKIEAVRQLRARTGLDLRDSKLAVDALERDLAARRAGVLPPRGSA